MDTTLLRNGELRVQSGSYALRFLAVLTVVHTARGDETRVISLRRASREEGETYHAWLEEDQ